MRFPERPPPFDPGAFDPKQLRGLLNLPLSPTLPDGRYLHWNELRHRKPPAPLSRERWWAATKIARVASRVAIPSFADDAGKPFWFCRLDAIDRATHQLDRRDAAREMIEALGDTAIQHQYRAQQLIEEAINSSVLEGAKLNTRAQAKAMIRENRHPVSRGEWMVLNNHQAITRLIGLSDQDLKLDDLLEIHSILGERALDTPDAGGRLRRDGEDVRVEDSRTGDVWFRPTAAGNLPERLALMLKFANQDSSSAPFIHPLVRAIVLHFWMAYLHPFVDGNGRMARALFYWQMLRSGYDFAQYLSISGPIERSPRSYYLAFVYTETDECDLTYFVLHQLAVLRRATDDLIEDLRQRSLRLKEFSVGLSNETLNHRQTAVLSFLVRNPAPGTTIRSHASSHDVTYLTARKDLQSLEEQGYLRRVRSGRTDRYFPSRDLTARLVNVRQGAK